MIFKTNMKTTLPKQITCWFLIFLMFLQSSSACSTPRINTSGYGQSIPQAEAPLDNPPENTKREEVQARTAPSVASASVSSPKKGKTATLAEVRYHFASEQREGTVGVAKGKHRDEPSDNLFKVSINRKVTAGDRVFLVYELSGVSDHTGVSKSINDRLATGGTLVKTNSSQTLQREEINPLWIQPGENTILFTIPENAPYSYHVSGLSIEIEKGSKDEELVIEKNVMLKDGRTYIKGFINTPNAPSARIAVDGKNLRNLDGAFEAFVNIAGQQPADLTVSLSNGKTLKKSLTFETDTTWSFENRLQTDFTRESKTFGKGQAGSLAAAGATIRIDSFALDAAKDISLTTLRETDLAPMNAGLSNVTGHHSGYRFLPHGEHFAQAAKVAIGYDRTKLPSGYTENDIQTFYFDTNSASWQALQRDSIDRENQVVVSRTTHFTDMINGVIKAPESPETAGYAPTSMSGIQAGDPTAKVQMIAPPSVNRQGSASMSYSFEMPPARNGMSPSLGIDYNSDRGEAWLGEGWDLPVPSVTVDTRWGVPRYDNDKETETYSLSGQMLMTYDDQGASTVAHRGDKIARKSDRRFYPRNEGSFSRIIRKGSSPGNYTWEVTDKAGTKYTYAAPLKGMVTTTGGQTEEVIAQWKLTRVEEVHGDWIEYSYDNTDESVRGNLTSKAMYLKEVRAGNKDQNPHTVVAFTSSSQKQKQTNSARYGFLTSSNKLLDKVTISFAGEVLRSYSFTYKPGAFQTTILEKVTHNDDAGNPFASHTFDYYDDVQSQSGYLPFRSQAEEWDLKEDNIQAKFINPASLLNNSGFSDRATALGGSETTSASGSFYAGVGPTNGDLATKSTTVGGSFSYSKNTTKGLSSLVDINGDGLPDKVFHDKGKLYYRPNLSSKTGKAGEYGEPVLIKGISHFSETSSNTIGYGGKFSPGYLALTAVAGVDRSNTTSKTTRYFSDVNNDGLIDLVDKGKVYFNHIELDDNGNAVPTFTLSSADTPSPIIGGGTITPGSDDADENEQDTILKYSPMQDIIKVWQAPFSGTVDISGKVALLAPTGEYDESEYEKADGVRVAIQVGGTEKWSKSISKGDATPYEAAVNAVPVEKGQKIYFRLQSGDQLMSNGAFDKVTWDPVISYAGVTNAVNPDGQEYYTFKSSEGDVISADNITYVPLSSSYKVKGTFAKPVTSDDVTLKVLLSNNPQNSDGTNNPAYRQKTVYEKTFKWDETFEGELEFPVTNDFEATDFRFQAVSSTNVAWNKVNWLPVMESVAEGGGTTATQAMVCYSVCAMQISAGEPYHLAADTTLNIAAQLMFASAPFKVSGKITMSVKNTTGLLAKSEVLVSDNTIISGGTLSGVRAKAGPVWVEFTVADGALPALLTSAHATITPATGSTRTVAAGCFSYRPYDGMGIMYRGWGNFVYNAAEGRYSRPIDESLLKLPETEDANMDPLTSPFIPMSPDMKVPYWIGQTSDIYVKNTEMSSARIGQQEVVVTDPLAEWGGNSPATGTCLKGTGAFAVNLESKSKSTAYMAGAMGVTTSTSEGESETTLSFHDMNGDGYPDIISRNTINFTNTQGGFDGENLRGIGNHTSRSNAKSAGYGGSAQHAASAVTALARYNNAVGTGDAQTSGKQKFDAAKLINSTPAEHEAEIAIYNSKTQKLPFNVSLDVPWNEDSATETFMDINGDGLPDKITSDKKVRINMGYSFSAPVDWGLAGIEGGKSTTVNAGTNFDLGGSSFAAGLGLSTTTSHTNYNLTDVNSDGLVDKVRKEGDRIYVSLSTGNSFAPEILWNGWDEISKTASTAESANGAFSTNIPIAFIKLTINPGVTVSQAMSRPLSDLRDVDGDGYPDIVSSDKDSKMTVKRSAIGRTGKLKSVTNPLGGTFTMDYEHSAATYGHPGGKWVLSSVVANDKLNDDGPVSKNRFRYENGRQERHEREFLGFGKVTVENIDTQAQTTDKVYRRSVTEYDVSNYYLAGNLLKSYIEDTLGNKYTESCKIYYSYEVTASGDLYKYKETPVCSDRSAAYTPLRHTQNTAYEGQKDGMITSQEHFVYNLDGSFGELRAYKYSDKGNLDASGNNPYNYQAVYSYTSNADKHILSLPSRVWVEMGQGAAREIKAEYDPDYGHLKKISRLVTSYPTNQYAETEMAYDNAGNIKQKTLPVNNKGQRMVYKYLYDRDYNMYVERIEDSFGYRTEFEDFDYRYGIPLTQRDINGYQMKTRIDNLGRISSVTSPNELAINPQQTTIAFEYNTTGRYAQTIHNDYFDASNPKGITTYAFVDGFGRTVQVKKESEVAGVPVYVVSGRVKYDAFGRVVAAFHPVTEERGDANRFLNPAFDAVAPAQSTYDILDRVVKLTLPDNSVTTTAYSLEKNTRNMVTTLTDALGNKSASFVNGSGLTTRTEQYSGPDGTITTRFEYDGLGQQTASVDTRGNRSAFVYDEGGRLNRTYHPARGENWYWYDIAGNLYQEGRGVHAQYGGAWYILYYYDYNRPKETVYTSATGKRNRIRYSYGSPNAVNNTAGRLALVEDETGAREYSYGRLGEIVRERRTVIVPNTAIATYETQWKYDSWGRIREMVYPDMEKLSYTYDTGGALKSLKGEKAYSYNYIQDIQYDKFGERSYIKYCNGVETSYTYNPLTRYMDNMKVNSTQKSQVLMDNAYAFDRVGNILNVTNSAPLPGAGGMGGQMKHTYSYDGLYRLVHAEGSYTGSNAAANMGAGARSAGYTLEMTYDNIHNVTSKKQSVEQSGITFNGMLKAGYDLRYNYRQDNPFHLENIEDNNYRTEKTDRQEPVKNTIDYRYDPDGNVNGEITHRMMKDGTRRDSTGIRRMLWNDLDQLEAVNENGYVSTCTYDYAGERTIRLRAENTEGIFVNAGDAGQRTQNLGFTLYVSPYFVAETGGKYTKHIYAGSERVVSKSGDSDSYGADPRRIEYAGSGTNFKPDYATKYTDTQTEIRDRFAKLEVPYTNPDQNDYVNGKGFCCNQTLRANINYEDLQYYYQPDHLGSSSLITNLQGEIVQHIEYVPYGEVFIEERNSTWNTPYLFNAKELDEETGLYYYGARYYNPRTSLWLSVDPMWGKYPGRSVYEYCGNNPVNRVDPTGAEPIRPQAGTIQGFVNSFNNTRSRMGTLAGSKAHDAMIRLGKTEFSWSQMRPMPMTTNPINRFEDKYIYTEKGGWMDMAHFMFYAGRSYDYKLQKARAQNALNTIEALPENVKRRMGNTGMDAIIKKANMDPVGEAVQDGYLQEMTDRFAAEHSAYSYEDLPSDKFGADFGANYFDPNSELSLGEQLQNYFMSVLGATTPEKAPNFNILPTTDERRPPSRTNHTTTPVYTKENQ